MAYSEKLAVRIREALRTFDNVEEKKMFGSIGFMVNGKLCVTAGPGRMMCRIDPVLHNDAKRKDGVEAVLMRGREYKGYFHISEENLADGSYFKYWLQLALDYNKKLI